MDYKNRQSNIELLRVLSMLMVIGLHCNYVSLGKPTAQSIMDDSSGESIRIFLENLCIVSVNTFVLISGYFGIRLRKDKLLSYLYQIFFFATVVLLCFILFQVPLSFIDSIKFYYSYFSFNWFVPAYLCLMLFSPIINSVFDTDNVKRIGVYLLLLFVVDVVMGYVLPSVRGIGAENGYSVLHLLFIYCLGRIIYIQKESGKRLWNSNVWVYLSVFLLIVVLNSIYSYGFYYYQWYHWNPLSYNNPMVIIGSVCLFLAFASIRMKSITVNWLASSAFSVFLLQANTLVYPLFIENNQQLYNTYSGIRVFFIFVLLIISLYLIAIMIDQVRIRSGKWLIKTILSK